MINKMENEQEMKEIVHNLRVIKDFGEFPRGKNVLFSRYKNLGLVNMTRTPEGLISQNSKVKLTKKGRQFITFEF